MQKKTTKIRVWLNKSSDIFAEDSNNLGFQTGYILSNLLSTCVTHNCIIVTLDDYIIDTI